MLSFVTACKWLLTIGSKVRVLLGSPFKCKKIGDLDKSPIFVFQLKHQFNNQSERVYLGSNFLEKDYFNRKPDLILFM